MKRKNSLNRPSTVQKKRSSNIATIVIRNAIHPSLADLAANSSLAITMSRVPKPSTNAQPSGQPSIKRHCLLQNTHCPRLPSTFARSSTNPNTSGLCLHLYEVKTPLNPWTSFDSRAFLCKCKYIWYYVFICMRLNISI
jgi:hypothetical protein